MAIPSIRTLGSLVQSLLPPSIFPSVHPCSCLKIPVFFQRVKPVTLCARQTQHDRTATTSKFSSITPRLQPPLPEVLPVSAFPASFLHPALPSMICFSKQCFATYSEDYIRGVPYRWHPPHTLCQGYLNWQPFFRHCGSAFVGFFTASMGNLILIFPSRHCFPLLHSGKQR